MDPLVTLHFDRCAPYLTKALEYAGGTHTLEDVKRECHEGRFQFWPGESSAVVTQIVEYPREKVLYFFLAGGNLGELERMYESIERWGVTVGCSSASLTGRKGWERTFLARGGWVPTHVVFRKSLDSQA